MKNLKKFITSRDFVIFAALLVLGLLTRTIFHLGPNFEFVTASVILGASLFSRKKLAILLGVSIMAVSDLIIGNTAILFFTWSGFAAAGLIGSLNISAKLNEFLPKLAGLQIRSMASVLLFYFWTNAGVVFVSTMYTKDIAGITNSLIAGLPFLKVQLISAIITVSLMYGGYYLARYNIFPRLMLNSK